MAQTGSDQAINPTVAPAFVEFVSIAPDNVLSRRVFTQPESMTQGSAYSIGGSSAILNWSYLSSSWRLLATLKNKLGLRTLMLTGDHAASAQQIAQEVGLDEVLADLKPEDKLRIVEKLSFEKGLIMIGDGLNDAPALARASIGISMGKIGSGAAIDASDVVFLNDNLVS